MGNNFFNSTFTKFCFEELPHNFTLMDIDSVFYKTYNDKSSRLRIIETKKAGEQWRTNQKEVLYALGKLFKFSDTSNTIFEIYALRGDPPYDLCNIYSFTTLENKIIGRDQLKSFLTFHTEFSDLGPYKKSLEEK